MYAGPINRKRENHRMNVGQSGNSESADELRDCRADQHAGDLGLLCAANNFHSNRNSGDPRRRLLCLIRAKNSSPLNERPKLPREMRARCARDRAILGDKFRSRFRMLRWLLVLESAVVPVNILLQ